MKVRENLTDKKIRQKDLEYIVLEFKKAIDFYRMEYSEDLISLFNEFGYLLICSVVHMSNEKNGRRFEVEKVQDWSTEKAYQYFSKLENDVFGYTRQSESLYALEQWHSENRFQNLSIMRHIMPIIEKITDLQKRYNSSDIVYDVARQCLDLCVNVKREQNASYILPDEIVRQLLELVYAGRKGAPVRILDFKCGSGAMLIAAGRYLKGSFCEGFEGDKKLWVTSQILGILSKIEIRVKGEEFLEKNLEMAHQYDLVLANPPFNNASVSWEQSRIWNEPIRGKYNLLLKQT